MAKIVYGVHGTGHGHAIRALTVARHFREHEFLFLSHGAGAAILQAEFPVVPSPCLVTVVRQHAVAGLATAWENLHILRQSRTILKRLQAVLDRFQPDLALTDYDFFLPRLARQTGLPCLSLDHQHIIPAGRHPLPWKEVPNYLLTRTIINALFSQAEAFLATSFFRPPGPVPARVRVVPPLLRDQVRACQPSQGEHVVAYQGYETFRRFFPLLQSIPRPVMVYGFGREGREGNLQFKKNSETGFLQDLATCAYLICGGSHTLLSEALFLGKPVLSFPIQGAFEQYLNAFYLERQGWGKKLETQQPDPALIPAFEARLPERQEAIRRENFCGNDEIFGLLRFFIAQRRLPLPGQGSEPGQ